MKRHIPNAITSANLLCGCISIYQMNQGDLVMAAVFILAGAFFDFFDGLAARMLKVSGEMGKQLDSLADVVSFGVAPSFIAFHLLEGATDLPYLPYAAFLIAVFSALRLAKFNIDERQSESFIGLPTPANALFWVGIALSYWQSWNMEYGRWAVEIILGWSAQWGFLIVAIIGFCYAMMAEMPLLSLKFKQFGWKGNEYRYILLISSVIFIALFLFASVPFILLLYLLLSNTESSRNSKQNEIHS